MLFSEYNDNQRYYDEQKCSPKRRKLLHNRICVTLLLIVSDFFVSSIIIRKYPVFYLSICLLSWTDALVQTCCRIEGHLSVKPRVVVYGDDNVTLLTPLPETVTFTKIFVPCAG